MLVINWSVNSINTGWKGPLTVKLQESKTGLCQSLTLCPVKHMNPPQNYSNHFISASHQAWGSVQVSKAKTCARIRPLFSLIWIRITHWSIGASARGNADHFEIWVQAQHHCTSPRAKTPGKMEGFWISVTKYGPLLDIFQRRSMFSNWITCKLLLGNIMLLVPKGKFPPNLKSGFQENR